MSVGVAVMVLGTLWASPPESRPAADDLGELLEDVRSRHTVPALAAAVVREGGLRARGAVGRRLARSRRRVEQDDRFHIGSCTKSMTATLCAMLVEQGRLRWDRTVGEAFPDLADKLHPGFRAATLEQLLCHRGGLPEDRAPDWRIWPKVLALRGDLAAQRRSLLELVLSRPPASEPGKTFAYSNFGFAVAGAMAEAATGQPFEDLLRRHLFEPLGMTTAGFGAPGTADKITEPRGHDSLLGVCVGVLPGPAADNPPVIAPAGTVHCSIGDLAAYAALHLDGARGRPRLLQRENFEKLHGDPFEQGYGFGWVIDEQDWAGGKVLGHDGSNGRWYAVILIAPARDLAFVVATNAADKRAQDACQAVIHRLRRRHVPPDKDGP